MSKEKKVPGTPAEIKPTNVPSIPTGPDGKPLTVEQQLQVLKNEFHSIHGTEGEVFANIFNQLVQAIGSLQNLSNQKDAQIQELNNKITELQFNLNQAISGKLPPEPKVKIHTKKN